MSSCTRCAELDSKLAETAGIARRFEQRWTEATKRVMELEDRASKLATENGGVYDRLQAAHEENVKLSERAQENTQQMRKLSDENDRMRLALKDLFLMMDEEILVRNTDGDGDPSWALKAMGVVSRLKWAHDAMTKQHTPGKLAPSDSPGTRSGEGFGSPSLPTAQDNKIGGDGTNRLEPGLPHVEPSARTIIAQETCVCDYLAHDPAKCSGTPAKLSAPEPTKIDSHTYQSTAQATYPCIKCGKLRTKDEGGTVFSVCDTCWDKPTRLEQEATQATCQCGHSKSAHIYEEGACRPGFACAVECGKYVASNASSAIGGEIFDDIQRKGPKK